ncbi:tellurite resistance TerB family protein [Anatilimnocola floriformis]|uniref:tellurite resistance TerB family protein n=1 Tax=Anatilimnocola floriformis TaxID=2948575 RepID=UPI0020C2093A|nr:tellurite resistance TerB family protein [Anatilimnocola floriformis]
MGLFDGLFNSMEGSTRLTPQECFAGILVGATFCDGHIADDEVNGLVAALLRMKLFQRLSEKQFGSTLDKVLGIAKRNGVPALLERSLENLPADLRDTAFANACNIVLADGTAEQAERDYINTLQVKLNLDPKTCQTIVQVMVIKNMG